MRAASAVQAANTAAAPAKLRPPVGAAAISPRPRSTTPVPIAISSSALWMSATFSLMTEL